jgi:hypothetical protein
MVDVANVDKDDGTNKSPKAVRVIIVFVAATAKYNVILISMVRYTYSVSSVRALIRRRGHRESAVSESKCCQWKGGKVVRPSKRKW